MIRRLAMLLVCLGCACATADSTGPAAEASAGAAPPPKSDVVCENELPTGSHIPVRRCRSASASARSQASIQNELVRPRNAGTAPPFH